LISLFVQSIATLLVPKMVKNGQKSYFFQFHKKRIQRKTILDIEVSRIVETCESKEPLREQK